MMLANLNSSPAAPATPGAAAPASAAPATPAAPGAAPAPLFASWLVSDAPAGEFDAAQGEASGEEAVPADLLADLPALADAPAQPVLDLDTATTPAMTMTSLFGMNLPVGIVLPQAVPVSTAVPVTAAVTAAPAEGAAPVAGATSAPAPAPLSFAVPAAPAPTQPAAPFAPVQAAVPASTVSVTFSAPPAASDNAVPADSGTADVRLPAAAPVAVPAPAVTAAAPAPRAPLRSGESTVAGAPVAQKTSATSAAQPFAAPADTMLRSDAQVTGAATVMAGANALAGQATAMAAQPDVKLPANPADWQQPLREALGDRLQLQLGRNIDQAVIRLDPPQLGRIEIAIRHAAGGALEVNISATNSEVRRQLNNVSDAMRSDLAQRQFSDVAVTITATPRSGAAFGEQQGRGRQQERDTNDNDPGRALSEAGQPSSTFSLSGREVAA